MPTSLHSPHLPALHGERQADVGLQLLFRCEAGHLWPFVLRPEPSGESAGCVCLQCLFCRLLFACHPLSAMPTALINILPRSSFALFPLFIAMCARIIVVLGPAVCKLQDCPVGSCNTGLQWRPVRRVHFDFPFSCRVHDPGPWV